MNRQLFNAMVAQYGTKTVMDTSQVLEWSGGAHCNLPSLKFYGLSEQYGTPTPEKPLGVYGFTGPCMVHNGPYFNTPTLHGIGEYKDEWDYVSGKGIRRVAKIEFTGKEYWAKYGANDGANGFYSYRYKVPTINTTSSKTNLAVSTHYPSLTGYGGLYYGQAEGVYAGGVNDETGWVIFGTTFPTSTDFNTFLAEQYANGTPVTAYYALADPQPFEERPDYAQYQAIPNDSGSIDIINSGMNTPFEISYITHSCDLVRSNGNLLNLKKREVVDFGANPNTTVRSFTGNGIIVGIARNNYYRPTNVTNFEKDNAGFDLTVILEQASYGIGFDLKVLPNTTYVCSFDEIEERTDNTIELAEYDGNGNWINAVYPTKSADGKARFITTSSNAVWGVFIFRNNNGTPRRYSNVSIRKE